MNAFEIEIKCLLGDEKKAQSVKKKLFEVDADAKLIDSNSQLNHYFVDGDTEKLYENIAPYLSDDSCRKKLKDILSKDAEFSIRTRLINGEKLLFIVKASIDEGSSHNTISRQEFEEEISELSLDELDKRVLDAGFTYQSKWSREREEYVCKGSNVCIDKNAGYGYLAEFEKVVDAEDNVDEIKQELYELMELVDAIELPQDRLERMFTHYNKHWPEYYGTNKIFVIE